MVNPFRLFLSVLCFVLIVSVQAGTKRVQQSDVVPVDFASGLQDIVVTDNVSAQQLWEALCGSTPPGITINSVAFPGSSVMWVLPMCGTYKNIPPISSVQMKDGIVLTSGRADNCIGPNSSGNTTFSGGYPGDADFTALVGEATFDVVALEINFTSDSTIPGFSFTFCYGTEEWKEYLGSRFNDVFACLFDGQNICFDTEGKLICLNSAFFEVDNLDGHINLEYDGFTGARRTSKTIAPGSHTIRFVIGDVSDAILDAGVFLSSFTFGANQNGTYPLVNIVEPQVFEISENAQSQTKAGTITNLCKYGPITLAEITDIPEFHIDGWNVVVSDGAVFDASVQDTYVIPVVAALDTLWVGGNPWIEHDTADVTVRISATDIYQNNPGMVPFSVSAIHTEAGKITVQYSISKPEKVTANLYNLSGKRLLTISEYHLAGNHTLYFKTEGLPNGSYIFTLQENECYEQKHKITLIR